MPDSFLWFHRDLPDEVTVPFEIDVVHRDERLVVVDKPHFLATIPRGRHIVQTALVRLRRELDLPTLSPAHRLDRVTAGLLMFVVRPEDRGRLPDAVPGPPGAQDLRGDRPRRPGGWSCRGPCAAASSSTAG